MGTTSLAQNSTSWTMPARHSNRSLFTYAPDERIPFSLDELHEAVINVD